MAARKRSCTGSIPGASTDIHEESREVSGSYRGFSASHEEARNAADPHDEAQGRAAVGQPERFTIEVSAADMEVLRDLLSYKWISDGFADTSAVVGGIVSDYLRFIGSMPSMKVGRRGRAGSGAS